MCCSLFVGTAEALAEQVTKKNFEKGLIYPPFSNIRKISAHIAASVATKVYEKGVLSIYHHFQSRLNFNNNSRLILTSQI